MPEILIYTTDYCPYCVKVKDFFKKKGYSNFKEIDVTNDADLRTELVQKSGGRKTVPQVFINGQHIGGCDDTLALDKQGKLDEILQK